MSISAVFVYTETAMALASILPSLEPLQQHVERPQLITCMSHVIGGLSDLRSLDLSKSNMQDEGMAALAPELKHLSRLTHLNFVLHFFQYSQGYYSITSLKVP